MQKPCGNAFCSAVPCETCGKLDPASSSLRATDKCVSMTQCSICGGWSHTACFPPEYRAALPANSANPSAIGTVVIQPQIVKCEPCSSVSAPDAMAQQKSDEMAVQRAYGMFSGLVGRAAIAGQPLRSGTTKLSGTVKVSKMS